VSGNVGANAGPLSAGVGVNAQGRADGTLGVGGNVSVGPATVGISGSTGAVLSPSLPNAQRQRGAGDQVAP
jgi:hypothetical protein